jgi:hypothetical protein
VTSDDSFRDGLRIGIGFALPGFVLAVSFGVLARDLGWGVVAPIVASIVVFSGSAQFAIANVLGAGGSAAAAIVAAVLVNARFAPMSVALASALKGGRVRRALEAQLNVDASWAIANRGDGPFDRELMSGRRCRNSWPGSAAPSSASSQATRSATRTEPRDRAAGARDPDGARRRRNPERRPAPEGGCADGRCGGRRRDHGGASAAAGRGRARDGDGRRPPGDSLTP